MNFSCLCARQTDVCSIDLYILTSEFLYHGTSDKISQTAPEETRLTQQEACAVDIALADGVLEDNEKAIISQLAEALQIPEKVAVSIIEVMIIKDKA